MRTKALSLIALLAFGPAFQAVAAGKPELPVHQRAIEATSRSISLPGNDHGVIVAKPCPTCAAVVLRMTSATTFRVGNSPVTYPQLQKFVATGGERNLVVLFDTQAHTITRIVITGQLTAARP